MNLINEKALNDFPRPIFIGETKIILHQMKNTVCRLSNKDGAKGTGFFCKIPLLNNKYIPALMTNNHVINQNFLKKENEIIVKINDDKKIYTKTINLKNNKIKYTNEEHDITIIEIDEDKDDIHELLEFDEYILKDTCSSYIGNSIYLLHYPNNFEKDKIAVSYGILKKRLEDKKYNFIHFCCTEHGSSGSPILNLSNNKIIGIHKQSHANKNYNVGSFLYDSLNEFIAKYNNEKKLNINKTKKTKELIKKIDKDDKIMNLFIELYNKGLVSDIILIKHKGQIIGKKFICSQKYLPNNYNSIAKSWIPAWHGTRINYLESIIKYGLKKPGTKLTNTTMTPKPNFYIPFNAKIDNITNWSNAIFASPRILCASDPYYSERIYYKKEIWCCLINVKIKPNSFTKHSSKVVLAVQWDHPRPTSPKDDIIYRISSDDNIIVIAITFFLYSFTNICGYSTRFKYNEDYDESLKLYYENILI